MHAILHLIHTPANLLGYTSTYLWWVFLSLPAAFLYNMYAASLRSSGDTVTALFILVAAVFSNLLLDIFLVAHLGLGIKGAAQATAFTHNISMQYGNCTPPGKPVHRQNACPGYDQYRRYRDHLRLYRCDFCTCFPELQYWKCCPHA